nr:hypothetical protein PJ912_22260 [Pectobacterium colocasium]
MQRIRLAFLATEGVFLLQGLGFVTLDREERQTMIDDAKSLLQPDDRTSTATAQTTAVRCTASPAPTTASSREMPPFRPEKRSPNRRSSGWQRKASRRAVQG